MPTRIVATPLDDVSAITFLGERVFEKHPQLKSWMLGSPAAIPYDTMPKRERPYRLAGRLGLESAYPIVQGYKDTAAAGYRVTLSDPLQLNRLILSATYSPARRHRRPRAPHLRAEYQRYDWRARAVAERRRLLRSLRADARPAARATRSPWVTTRRSSSTSRAAWSSTSTARFSGNLDRLPEYQNVAVGVTRLFTLTARLAGTDVRGSLGKVDDEKGARWGLVGRGDYVNGTFIPKLHGTFDLGFALPMGHSSVWWRSAAGFSTGDPDDPFANFYFGGFGNNYVDHRDEQRYRMYYAFPGVEFNEIPGRNFVKGILEWALPPIRFSRAWDAGLPPHLGAAGRLRHRPGHGPRQRVAAARVCEHWGATRFPLHAALERST